MSLPSLRNIGIVAHIDAGKTTVSERMLFYTGVEHRMGEVHEGTAVMDYMDEERRRGITITSAATSLPWKDTTINLIDTPGHVDFTVEVERCLRVLDGAVLVLNGVAGVQAQSETVWRQMQRHEVPYLVFVNQCDRAGADYFRVLADFKKRLGAPAIPIQMPVGSEREFRGVVDLIEQVHYRFEESDRGAVPTVGGIPPELVDEVGVLRAELLEALANEDEAILAAVLEERQPEVEAVRKALREAVLRGSLVPALCGAALRNVGIQPLLDAVLAYLPAPPDVPPVRGTHPKTGEECERPADLDAPTAALAFKLVADPHEDLTFVRVYSGALKPGAKIFNPRVGRMERISRILRMHADHRQPLEVAGPGEIVALSGCKLTATGDTLCDRADPIVLERLSFPEPVITMVVEPKVTGDRDKLRAALERLEHEDPTFRVREDEETGQWLISGMGELHLEVLQHRLETEFHVEAAVGQPRVAYRESALGVVTGSAQVERVMGAKEVFGAVTLELRPAEEGSAPPAVVWDDGGAIPAPMRPSVEQALMAALDSGPRFGFPVVGVEIRITGGASDPARDSEAAFAQAASGALREALGEARVQVLEPVMTFDVRSPEEYVSGIIADLNAQGAEIRDVVAEGESRAVTGTVALAHMFGYTTNLRSLSQGRASFSMQPAGFRAVEEDELVARGLVWT